MKAIFLLLLVLAISCDPVRCDTLTRDQAIKMGADNDGIGNGKFWFEHGDSSPPFTHAGHITITCGNQISLTLNDGATSGLGVDAPYDDESVTRLDFFTSSKGRGWVVAHVLKPEIANTRPKGLLDNRHPVHKALSSAAELAIDQGDGAFLASLLKRGIQVNESIDFESGNRLLHVASLSGKLDFVKFLLENGANPNIRNRYGQRPIDHAIRSKNKELCELLAKPKEKDVMVDGVPSGLVQELLVRQSSDEITFISWNGKDPSAELLAEIRKTAPKARPASRMTTLERRPLGAHSWFQDKNSKEFGTLIEVSLSQDGDVWTTSVRRTVAPAMAGGGWKGKACKGYGYWYTYDVNGWDE